MKKRDKLELLLDAYKETSAKRIAKQREAEEREAAKKKAREEFEAEAMKKVTYVVRPVMKKFMERLGGKGFHCAIGKWGENDLPVEQYFIKAKKKDSDLCFAVKFHEKKNEVVFHRVYSIGEKEKKPYEKFFTPSEITRQLVSKQFIKGFEKISLAKKKMAKTGFYLKEKKS